MRHKCHGFFRGGTGLTLLPCCLHAPGNAVIFSLQSCRRLGGLIVLTALLNDWQVPNMTIPEINIELEFQMKFTYEFTRCVITQS